MIGRDSWAKGAERAGHVAEIERRAAAYGLPPIVWPDPWPAERLFAMRVAIFAKQTGRTVSYALAAFRQAFAAGRSLSDTENVLVAAAACELHPKALLKAAETRSVQEGLREATERAFELGVPGIPALVVDGKVFWGDDRLEDAVAAAHPTPATSARR
jgi:2-hydroxychromene-2-carboxylate isomerase